MKKLLLVLCLSLAAIFSACQRGGLDGQIVMSIWSGYPEVEPFFNHAAEAYSRLYPNVKVETLTNPLREFEQRLAAAIPSDTAADILDASNYTMRRFVEAGLVPHLPDNVESFVNAPERFGGFAKEVRNFQGRSYGVPFFQGRTVLFYNIDMLREAGFQEPPGTLTQMAEYARKLTVRDAQGNITRSGHSLRIAGQGSGIAEKFWFILFPMGGTILEESRTQPGMYHAGFDNEAGRRAMAYYIDSLYAEDSYNSFTVRQDAEAFQLELTAMFLRESWVIGDIAQRAPNLNYGTTFVPSDSRWGRIEGHQNLYVTRSSRNPKTAWDFVLYLVNDDNSRWMLDNVGWLPSRTDVDYSEILERIPQFRAFVEVPRGYEQYGYIPIAAFDEVLTRFADRISTAFLDSSLHNNSDGIARVMSEAAEEANNILRRSGLFAE